MHTRRRGSGGGGSLSIAPLLPVLYLLPHLHNDLLHIPACKSSPLCGQDQAACLPYALPPTCIYHLPTTRQAWTVHPACLPAVPCLPALGETPPAAVLYACLWGGDTFLHSLPCVTVSCTCHAKPTHRACLPHLPPAMIFFHTCPLPCRQCLVPHHLPTLNRKFIATGRRGRFCTCEHADTGREVGLCLPATCPSCTTAFVKSGVPTGGHFTLRRPACPRLPCPARLPAPTTCLQGAIIVPGVSQFHTSPLTAHTVSYPILPLLCDLSPPPCTSLLSSPHHFPTYLIHVAGCLLFGLEGLLPGCLHT